MGLVWYLNGQKLYDCGTVQYSNTQLNLVRYSDYHLNTGHLNTGQVQVPYSDVSIIQIPT